MQYCCSTPVASGVGNISADPQLVDASHLALNSPCRNAGTPSASYGTDLDGESWSNPPSIGCDELVQGDLTGLLSVAVLAAWPEVAAGGSLPLTGQVTGRAARVEWSFGDGITASNTSYLTSHTWTNPGDYTVVFSAFNTDNPGGVATNLLIHVVPLQPPLLSVDRLSGLFNLRFEGQAGVTYVVEQTTNLVAPVIWQTVKVLTGTGGIVQVADPGATNGSRFYRTRTQ